ncbi:MAG: corrinoid protein [Anaerolineales bacterium]|jgi:corrinoid protein of di/trimethylamine methyltransferase
MTDDLLTQLTQAVLVGDYEAAAKLTRDALAAGMEPLTVIDRGLVPGMDQAGEKFSSGEYFLPNLLIAARAMQESMDILEPELLSRDEQMANAGTVVIGTVHGDIHEIGKSLVGTMFTANGFKVYDLGVDVPVETFVDCVRDTNADILGLSALLTTTMVVQREVIEALSVAGLREDVKVLVGGAPVSAAWAQEIGADGYAADAVAAVRLAQQVLGRTPDSE